MGYVRNGSSWTSADGTVTKFSFAAVNVATSGKSVDELRKEGYIDATGNLVAQYDAATAKWGAPWRMPTAEELEKFKDSSICKLERAELNGVKGYRVTGTGDYADKSLFMPDGGYGTETYHINASDGSITLKIGDYWTSTPSESQKGESMRLYFDTNGTTIFDDYTRVKGFPVRPVRDAE